MALDHYIEQGVYLVIGNGMDGCSDDLFCIYSDIRSFLFLLFLFRLGQKEINRIQWDRMGWVGYSVVTG